MYSAVISLQLLQLPAPSAKPPLLGEYDGRLEEEPGFEEGAIKGSGNLQPLRGRVMLIAGAQTWLFGPAVGKRGAQLENSWRCGGD